MSLSGSEDLIKALGFAEVQSAREARYGVSVRDAHSGMTVVDGARFSGSRMVGVFGDSIDIEIGANFALGVASLGSTQGTASAPNIALPNAAYANVAPNFVSLPNVAQMAYGSYTFTKGAAEFVVHISDGTTVLQVGANEGETFALSFGDVSSSALGIAGVRVTSRELAASSITKVDGAISKVSKRRADLGAYQNRLEHTISDLAQSSTDLKASESRIRDVDMAREMMTFTKLNILSQAGSSMLAQANALPQNVLSLLR